MSRARFADRAVALFLLGLVVFVYPGLSLLAAAGRGWLWAGLFVVWAGFILLLAALHRRADDG